MGIDEILSRLRSVRTSGADRWMACCPAHDDRSPSLLLSIDRDGRIGVSCFAGCETRDVIGAIGVTWGDLFPVRSMGERSPRIRARFTALEALRCLANESAIVAIAASDVAEGKPITGENADRVCLAAGRIASALEAVHA